MALRPSDPGTAEWTRTCQSLWFAAPTQCRRHERHQHPCQQRWQTAARVERGAQTSSRTARSPGRSPARRAGGGACGAGRGCACRALGWRFDPRDRRSSRSIAPTGVRVAQRHDGVVSGRRVRGGGSDMRLKVLIADDHPLMLAAVRMAFSDAPDIEIVGEATAGQEVLPLVGRTSPDVVLLDLRMPGMDGLRCLELLHERHPSVKAIIFSGSDDPAAVDAAFARGAVALHPEDDRPRRSGRGRSPGGGRQRLPRGRKQPSRCPHRSLSGISRRARSRSFVRSQEASRTSRWHASSGSPTRRSSTT